MNTKIYKSFKGVQIAIASKVKVHTNNAVYTGLVCGTIHNDTCLELTDIKEIDTQTGEETSVFENKPYERFFDFVVKSFQVIEL